jgi:UDP-glucose 4-epimerase
VETSGLVVAVTGPTGEIGRPFIRALESRPEVAEIRGMARSPFDPAAHGWTKTTYVQGDILDRSAVDDLVTGADVVVHLAFIIFGDPDESRRVNLQGSRNVFEAAVDAGVTRLVYTSSVAAYGFDTDRQLPLTEDTPATGSSDLYYSAHKAELERTLHDILGGTDVDAYVFRPCIVCGPESPALVVNVPYIGTAAIVPEPLRSLIDRLPGTGPVLPDPGIRMQLVHADDVADALVKGVLGDGPPGIYNLAGDGEFGIRDLADALGWRTIPVPSVAVDVTAELVRRLPAMPAKIAWVHAVRSPVIMDTTRAREDLGWQPKYDAMTALAVTVEGARGSGHVDDLGRRRT